MRAYIGAVAIFTLALSLKSSKLLLCLSTFVFNTYGEGISVELIEEKIRLRCGTMEIEINIKKAIGEGQRNKAIDCYKGVLIVLVVLGHIFEYSVSDWNHNILQNLIWAVQMPGFMLVSGYFSFREVKNGEKLLVGYRKSVERYLLPFLTWFVLISVLLLGNYEHNVLTALISLAWRVDGGLWFIWVVFVLSLIMGLCNLIRGKVNGFVKQLLTVAVTVGVSYGVLLILAKLTSINFLGIKFILYYGLFYALGWFIRWTQSF